MRIMYTMTSCYFVGEHCALLFRWMACMVMGLTMVFCLLGCSPPVELKAPCPDYGRTCHQTPINTWNFDDA